MRLLFFFFKSFCRFCRFVFRAYAFFAGSYLLALLCTCLGTVSLTVWSMKFYYLEADPPYWLKRLITSAKSVLYCRSEQSNIEKTEENSNGTASSDYVSNRQLVSVNNRKTSYDSITHRIKSERTKRGLPMELKPPKQEHLNEIQSHPVSWLSAEDENNADFSGTPYVNGKIAKAQDMLCEEQLSAGSETSSLQDEKLVFTWKRISELLDRIYFITSFTGITLLNIILIASLANRDSSFYNQP